MTKILIDEATVKLVLEALEWCHGGEPCGTSEAITALQEAPAEQPAQQKQDIPDLIAGAFGVSRGTAYEMMREALAAQPDQSQSCYCLNCEELSKQVTALKLCVEVERGFNAQEQPAQQEPVAWMDASGDIYKHELWPDWNPPHTPLYTSPSAQQHPHEFKFPLCYDEPTNIKENT